MDPTLTAALPTGQASDFWQIIVGPALYGVLVWLLFLRRLRLSSGLMNRRPTMHIARQIIAGEIVLAVVMTAAGSLAFIFFFADHQPYPFPFNFTRLFAAVELAAVTAIDVAFLRWLRRRYYSIGASGRVQGAFAALNVMMFILTTWPLVLVLLAGD